MLNKSTLIASLLMALSSSPLAARETVLYCVAKHTVGMIAENGDWKPTYENEASGKRYTIRFSDDFSQVVGVEGTDTAYNCQRAFPNKAPDVVTCLNSRVLTMVFNYSTETGRFLLSMVSPGGWLGVDTKRTHEIGLLSDHIVMGECQSF
ncbi:hypothetical protein MUY35_03165 [Aliiroseovarius sp. S1339]|uniref:hypothetical protein n=1 Tax=Aliiroseovarius sp. S1339 TaxID=2936990 RepID=UPI0020C0DA81|nr:hypothetical protein [Aliiroseovarius sp. S1339]MCK8462846.1 hypothetical protein [Aliiroseovarius sp. S1339]